MSDDLSTQIEDLLKQITGAEEIEPDEDGDWLFEVPAGMLVVHAAADDPARVELRAQVTEPVPASDKLAADVLALNGEAVFSRICLYDGSQVVVEADLFAATLDRATLEITMDIVGGTMAVIAEDFLAGWQTAS
ncbi:hypothetical protein BH09ACT11_BH09ACT11_16790 [soil metagenome]